MGNDQSSPGQGTGSTGGATDNEFSEAPVGDAALPCTFKSKVTKKSGGISGVTLDVTFEVEKSECNDLQVIQIVWASGGPSKVGKMRIKVDGKDWDCFVDGGKNSPYVLLSGNPAAHPSKPYYLTKAEVKAQVKYDSSTGKGTIRVYDKPGAVFAWDKVYFETAIMCVNYKKSGKDKVLKVFKWGWIGKGTTYQTSPGSGKKSSGFEEYDSVSKPFKAVVNNDYPVYSFT